MMPSVKPKIINIMPHGPAYHFSPGEKPDVYWEKPDGSFLGFWTREWPDLLGEAVLKQTDKYDWEVWQPDYRADRIYSKTLDTGVCHRLFPAKDKVYRIGVRNKKSISSDIMISRLKNDQNSLRALKLYGTYGLHLPFYNEILRIFGPERRFPVFYVGLGMFSTPLYQLFEIHKPLTYIDLIVEHYRLKKTLKFVDLISEMADSAITQIRKVYAGRTEKLTMGCDFDFWIPVPSLEIRNSVRQDLNIPLEKTVFLATGNFQPRKQLDKLLKVFRGLSDRNNFVLNITGHGDKANTELIKSLAEPLMKKKRAILHSFVNVEKLRNIYWASDIYISTAMEEGGPVSVMKAMACGLPVVSTPTGNTVELMKKHAAGMFIRTNNYGKWAQSLTEILDGNIPSKIDINIARNTFDWKDVAQRFIQVYHNLCVRKH